MTEPRQKAIELVKKMINKVYCYMGSGMLTNTYDEGVALDNAKECATISMREMSNILTEITMKDGRGMVAISNELDYVDSVKEAIEQLKIEDIFPPKERC